MQSCITPSGGFTLGDTRKTSRTKQLLLGAMSSVRNHSKIPVFKKNLLQAEYRYMYLTEKDPENPGGELR